MLAARQDPTGETGSRVLLERCWLFPESHKLSACQTALLARCPKLTLTRFYKLLGGILPRNLCVGWSYISQSSWIYDCRLASRAKWGKGSSAPPGTWSNLRWRTCKVSSSAGFIEHTWQENTCLLCFICFQFLILFYWLVLFILLFFIFHRLHS